jgi:hypothetical protein
MKLFKYDENGSVQIVQETVDYITSTDSFGAKLIKKLILDRWDWDIDFDSSSFADFFEDENLNERDLFVEITKIRNIFLTTTEFFLIQEIIQEIKDKQSLVTEEKIENKIL